MVRKNYYFDRFVQPLQFEDSPADASTGELTNSPTTVHPLSVHILTFKSFSLVTFFSVVITFNTMVQVFCDTKKNNLTTVFTGRISNDAEGNVFTPVCQSVHRGVRVSCTVNEVITSFSIVFVIIALDGIKLFLVARAFQAERLILLLWHVFVCLCACGHFRSFNF